MRVYIFEGEGNLYAFTRDETGGNLPADRSPWTLFKSVEMFENHPAKRIGVDEREVLAGIEGQGFYLTTARVVVEEDE